MCCLWVKKTIFLTKIIRLTRTSSSFFCVAWSWESSPACTCSRTTLTSPDPSESDYILHGYHNTVSGRCIHFQFFRWSPKHVWPSVEQFCPVWTHKQALSGICLPGGSSHDVVFLGDVRKWKVTGLLDKCRINFPALLQTDTQLLLWALKLCLHRTRCERNSISICHDQTFSTGRDSWTSWCSVSRHLQLQFFFFCDSGLLLLPPTAQKKNNDDRMSRCSGRDETDGANWTLKCPSVFPTLFCCASLWLIVYSVAWCHVSLM